MEIVKIAAALVVASTLAGCSTHNKWQTRVEAYFMNPARSCASGYYDCSLRTSNRARDQSFDNGH
jgi:hypothetical protein